jgi:hypothetical protein
VVFGDTTAIPLPPRNPARAVPGALVARNLVRIDEQHWRTTAPIPLPAPFGITLPAGRMMATRMDGHGHAEICDFHDVSRTFRPFEDKEGHFYPTMCLRGPAADGSYARVSLEPYQDKWEARSFAVPPVRIESAPVEAGLASSVYAVRRLRVGAVEGGVARLDLEDCVFSAPQPGQSVDVAIDAGVYRVAATLDLPLAEGASASIGGVTVTAHRDAAGWRIAASGDFSGFTRLADGGASVVTVKPH